MMKKQMFFPMSVMFCMAMGVLANTWAWNPPTDSAGPLALKIDGPESTSDRTTPFHIALHNDGDTPVKAEVRLDVVDDWRIAPESVYTVDVAAKGDWSAEVSLTAGPETYNAYYPLHARAEADVAGAHLALHAILIFQTRFPDPPEAPKTVTWHPLELGRDARLGLWHAPVFRMIAQPFADAAPTVFAPGWEGSDERTRAFMHLDTSADRGGARDGIVMHPPWNNGTGVVAVEFPLTLPADQPIHLQFGNAMRDTFAPEPPSDGVTFRVRVAAGDAPDGTWGELLFERHVADKTWQDADVDLNAYAGKSIRLQLEAHPGPKNDTTCDQCFWGDPMLSAGTPPPPPNPENLLDATKDAPVLGALEGAGAPYTAARAAGDTPLAPFVLRGDGGAALSFAGVNAIVAGNPTGGPEGLAQITKVTDADGTRRYAVASPSGAYTLAETVRVEGAALRISYALEDAPAPVPWTNVHIEDLAFGPWSANVTRVYAGVGNVIESPEKFTLHPDGHQLASSFVGFDFDNGMSLVQAVDLPPLKLDVDPKRNIYTLHAVHNATFTLIPCVNVWEGVKALRALDTRPAAGGVPVAAGRFVFDLWGGRYGDSAKALEDAFAYGLTDTMVVWHNWQRWGYDYRLPDIWPPSPDMGTLEEFQQLAETCRAKNVTFAPHDNYIDLYPDADEFSYKNIAFYPNNTPVLAWNNEGRKAQALRWRSDTVRPILEKNILTQRDAVHPTGYFIDVWSSIRPYDYWTSDGAFHTCVESRDIWGQCFAWIRDTFGDNAPQISESGHDQLVGYLDGAQCNHLRNEPKGADMTWGIRCADNERIPWLDALLHDRFILHGAGYSVRYQGGLDFAAHGIYSDDYIATEVLDGHPAMVPEAFNREVVRKYWLLAPLGRALALAKMERLDFDRDNIHRQHVVWDNGIETWVNRGTDDWSVGETVLPQYGFLARAADGRLCAAIERRNGAIVESCITPDVQYVNGRMPSANAPMARATAEKVAPQGGGVFALRLRWDARKPTTAPMHIFVHAVDADGKILFQGDHPAPIPTTMWTGTVRTDTSLTVPEALRGTPGNFEIRTGLYAREDGKRAALEGLLAGDGAIRLGVLHTDAAGGGTWESFDQPRALEFERGNPDGAAIDFDGIATPGACRIATQDGALVATPLPGGAAFAISLAANRLPWEVTGEIAVDYCDRDGKTLETATAIQREEKVIFEVKPEAFQAKLRQK